MAEEWLFRALAAGVVAVRRACDGTARERLQLRRADGPLFLAQLALRGLDGDRDREQQAVEIADLFQPERRTLDQLT